MNNKIKRITSLIIVLAFIFGLTSGTLALSADYDKEEVVYVLLNGNGDAKDIYVVNSYENLKGNLVDYGEYTTVRNLSTEDILKNENGTITGNVTASKFYYEGKLADTQIPWSINIEYTLDGKAIAAKELAGKSGKLQIAVIIAQNENSNEVFFQNYALQIGVILDTNKCQNIIAEGATIANAGENKNITYMLLPNKAGEYKITADVQGFEMEPISINGIPFNMKIDLEDIDNMTSGITALSDGIAKLDDGASKLQKGAKQLKDGMNALNRESNTLANGSKEVLNAINQINTAVAQIGSLTADTGGLAQLKKASTEYAAAINELADKCQELPKASQAVYEGIKSSYSGLSGITADDNTMDELIKSLAAMNNPSVNVLIQAYKTKMDVAASVAAGLSALKSQYQMMNAGIAEIATAIKAIAEGYTQIDAGIGSINMSLGGLSQLGSAINTLAAQYAQFNNGIIQYTGGFQQLVSGYGEIFSGIIEINKGTAQLHDNTKDMDTQIKDKLDSTLSQIQGSDFTPVSFTSSKNTNTSAVQFVMKTDDIKIPEQIVKIEETPEKLSFWQKLIALFKR